MPDPNLDARRDRALRAWNLSNEIVLIHAGHPIQKPGGFDQCYPFAPHPHYRWLTNQKRPGSVLAFDPTSGWQHFVEPVTEHERVWDGDPPEPVGLPVAELEQWKVARAGRPVVNLGSSDETGDLAEPLTTALDHERRKKDDWEVALMRRTASATAAGYALMPEVIRPGVTERQIQIELEAGFARAGADGTGYASIVGTGTNSRVFHFTPGGKAVAPEDLILIDAGAMIDDYVIDVTRTYTATGKWEGRHADVRAIVRAAQEAVFALCKPGVRWSECHRAAAMVIAQGLADLGLSKVSAQDLCESGAVALFLPHGVGHAVGLGVRDSGGAMPGAPKEPSKVCGVNIRVDLPLEPGFVMTIEPGLYIIPALLDKEETRSKFADVFYWDRLESWKTFGGLRLEDNLLITDSEPENLTAMIPW
ncbi:MAG TPA: M24 family metallopeptidase [Fimbriimonadaceae bacterium]|nr:M24 family metallopeptidase [Fimbriimonadaceae bacterium]